MLLYSYHYPDIDGLDLKDLKTYNDVRLVKHEICFRNCGDVSKLKGVPENAVLEERVDSYTSEQIIQVFVIPT